jgi:glycosyltransferase involved in cell wall biosynthesis
MVQNSPKWSSDLDKPSRTDGRIRLGYASGTPTHQKDFGQISACLATILAERPETVLTVVGHLDLTEFPELVAHRGRIEVRPHVSHDQLAAEYARFDVNLAPLQIGNPFCEGKSELKYFEAASVRVPTVASATVPFKTAIRSGINGYCVETQAEWQKCLIELIEDRTARRRVGEEAYWHAIVRFGPEAQCLDGLKVLGEVSINPD